MTSSRRNFIKQLSVSSVALAAGSLSACAAREQAHEQEQLTNPENQTKFFQKYLSDVYSMDDEARDHREW